MDLQRENQVRAKAFRWLDEQLARFGSSVPAQVLSAGFEINGTRVPLTSQQGINKPKILDAALSLRTSIQSPYQDHWIDDWTLAYRYQGKDPDQWTNRAARLAWEHGLPLIYLQAVRANPVHYAVIYPVFITQDDPKNLAFHLSPNLAASLLPLEGNLSGAYQDTADMASDPERRYSTRLVKTRLHQVHFRERVLAAYRSQCAMCRLKHPKLLEAAHITPDHDIHGEPTVTNGMSLCRIHHGAFDAHYLSVNPKDMRVHLLPTLLEEEDGPMLKHGLQELQGTKIQLPREVSEQPDPDRLRKHWEIFVAAC